MMCVADIFYIFFVLVLKKLLAHPECISVLNKSDLSEEEMMIYRNGQVSDTFTLVIEGSLKAC